MSKKRTDIDELNVYRLIIPTWVYVAALKEFKKKNGDPYKLVEGIGKEQK